MGQGRKSGPVSVRTTDKKPSLEISSRNKAGKRNGRHLSRGGRRPFSGSSRLSIASVALESRDMTPVVWRPKEEIEVLSTVQ